MMPFFAYKAKKPLDTGVRTGLHYLVCLSVCLPACLPVCLPVCPSVYVLCMCNIRGRKLMKYTKPYIFTH